ncbi:hypothetical protein L2E82_40926 [Cichorium intybus]|uniref:Uncharacterized protein n=1 Tax=Cichorium intybus TaxID=13427 RepID=A0ACB9AMX2_CICIN|nr:hypothetical protein L2E82_40926 [Cichorium intybus]
MAVGEASRVAVLYSDLLPPQSNFSKREEMGSAVKVRVWVLTMNSKLKAKVKGAIPLSFSKGNNGGLDWFVVSEIAATIIYEIIQNKTQMKSSKLTSHC